MSRRPHAGTLAGAAWLLAGCATPPPPASVQLSTAEPARWTAAAEAAPDDRRIADRWWQGFGDPQLDAYVERTLANNRDLMAATARMTAAMEQARIAGALSLPMLDAAFTPERAKRVFVGFPFGGGVPSVTATTYGLSLNLTWEIDLWGRLRAAESAALADAQAAAADFAAVELSLVAQSMKAYFATVESRQQVALAEATLQSVRATAEDVRDRFRRGVRPAVDAYQAETQVAQATAAVSLRKQQLQAAIRQLEILLGDYPAGAATGAAALSATLPEVPAGLPSQLLGRRPDLAAAERRLAAAGCRVDVARAALYPRISLTASGGTTSDDLANVFDSDYSVWSLGANILQPLFQGGALVADVRRNEAFAAEALYGYASSVLVAFAEVEIALADSALLADEQLAATAAATNAAAARDLARERYQFGLTDFLAVADGQRLAFTTESERIALERRRLDNRIDLFLALGGGFAAAPPNVETPP